MARYVHIIDATGYPAIVEDPKYAAKGKLSLADNPAASGVLTLSEAAELLTLNLDDTAKLLTLNSVSPVVAYERSAVVRLANK